jgi:hypothetical protein
MQPGHITAGFLKLSKKPPCSALRLNDPLGPLKNRHAGPHGGGIPGFSQMVPTMRLA